MLRDPNQETGDIARAAGVTREEAGRAARIALSLGRAKAEELLALPPALALPLLDAALAAGRQDVLAAAAAHPQREIAKAGKRILYQLKLRGAPVPEVPRARPLSPPPPPAEPAPRSYASGIDSGGERIYWMARNVPGKGVEVVQATVDDERGIVELVIGWVGRKVYRGLGQELLGHGASMSVAEVDRERALAEVVAAAALNASTGAPLPEGASAWLARQGAVPAPPEPGLPALPEEEERAALAASGALHRLPLLRGWLAHEEALRALANRLDEISVSSLYVDEAQRAAAASSAVEDALVAYLDDGRRRLWARRLGATAEHLLRLGDAEGARLAGAAARALAGAGSGADAARIPFARLLVTKALPEAAQGAPAPRFAPAAEGSLILSPSGAPAAGPAASQADPGTR